MNRLYPQVLKAEQDIQDLRRRLGEAEDERRDQGGHLAAADRQIRGLHGQLDEAERQQRDSAHALCRAESKGHGLQEVLRGAAEEAESLRGWVGKLKEENSAELSLLDRAIGQSRRTQSETGRVAADIRDLSKRLGVAEARCSELGGALAEVEWENTGLLGELDGAECVGGRFAREELGRATRAGEEQRDHNTQSVAEGEEWCRHVEHWDRSSRELRHELCELQELEQGNYEMRGELDTIDVQDQDMSSALAQANEESHNLEVALNQAEAHNIELRSRWQEAKIEGDRHLEQISDAQSRGGQMEALLAPSLSQGSKLLAALRRAEESNGEQERELTSELAAVTGECGDLHGQVEVLQAADEALKARIDRCQAETRSVCSTTAGVEKEIHGLEGSNAELERLILELRKKVRCTIS